MQKSRKLISLPIVTLQEGLQIGTVKNLIVDPVKMEVTAIFVEQKGWFQEQKIVHFSKIRHIGDDAMTIDDSGNVQRIINLPAILKLINDKFDPVGTKVITTNGTVLGVVEEYYIEDETGKISTLEIAGRFLEGLFKGRALLSTEHVNTMGTDVIIVKPEAQDSLEKLDGGLQETLFHLKDETSSLLESTYRSGRKLSREVTDKCISQIRKLNTKKTEVANPSANPPEISQEGPTPSEPEQIYHTSSMNEEPKSITNNEENEVSAEKHDQNKEP